jgi:hypothetical protein
VGLLNYAGKFDANLPIDGTGAHSHGHLHVDSVSAHALQAPAGAIIVPDAQLLFNGDFKRSGVDLILSNHDHELVLPDYFKGEKRAALSSPDGAHLTGDIINALTGHQQFAQADGSASVAKVIGHVSKLAGTATAIRNGVSIILNNGDDVQKGDVVQAGSNSTLGVTFIDGTVFGLSSNAKMVLNEMVYDPNGSSNSSLISLVAGTISFVAGETAKHGDMKVDTPVATMGIRGTAVLVEIDFDVPQNGAPNAKFQVLVEPDGHTGNYVLFDKVTLAPIATVDQAGVVKSLSQGILTSYSAPLSADVQKLITDVFSLKFTDNTNPNTKSFDHFTDTLLPQAFTPIKLADGATAVPIIVNVNTTGTALSSGPGGPTDSHSHIPGPPLVAAVGGGLIEQIGVTHSSAIDTVIGTINFVDVNAGDTPTVTTKFDSFTYQNAQHQDVTATLNALQLADIAKVEANLLLTPDPGNNNNGGVTWTYSVVDSAFDFLSIGETLTLTYVARVDNNFAPNDEAGSQKFTITITRGSNDVPVITTGPQTVPFSGGTTTSGGDLPASGPTSGTLAFTDVDLTDTHTVSTKLTSAVLPGTVIPPGPLAAFEAALSASIASDSTGSGSGTISWKVADLPVFLADFIPKGETLTLTYTVTVTDSQNATATQNIIVTITGTAAPAVVWVATTTPGSLPGGLWSDAANWETGTVPTLNDDVIIITDQLHGLTPSFPVTINAPAFAKSVTMNDFGTSAPELINHSTLTISGVLSLAADSIIDNSGTISVGDLMEVLNASVLKNSGIITLANGGDFKDHSKISNTITGTIDLSGGTLNVQVDIANSGKVTVETNAKLTLGSAAIDGGTVTNKGEIDLAGSAVLKGGVLGNFGQIKVSGAGNALHKETVTANHALEILAGGALLLDLGTTVANAGGTVTVDGLATLTLDTASIDGGTVTDKANGSIDLTGSAVLKNGALGNSGQINVSDTGNAMDGETVTNFATGMIDVTGTLTLDLGTSITGGILTNSGLVKIETAAGATLDGVTVKNGSGIIQVDEAALSFQGTLVVEDGTTITGGTLTIGSLGLFEVQTSLGATLDGVKVGNSGVVQVDAGSVLNLKGTTITDGSVTGDGTIHVTGDSAIDGAKLDTSQVTVDVTRTLTLDDTTVTGTAIADSGAVKVDATTTLKLSGVHLTGGAIENLGTIDVFGDSSIVGDILTNTNAALTVDAGQTLILDGTEIIGGTINDNGTVKVDSGNTLKLNGTTVIGGTITDDGTIDVAGDSTIKGGTLLQHGGVTIESGATLTRLDQVAVSGTTITGTTIPGTGVTGIVQTESGQTVTLNGSTITGGTLDNDGIIDSIGISAITDVNIDNTGKIEATSGVLTIDPAAGVTLSNSGTIQANGGELVLAHETVASSGAMEALSGSLLVLDHTTVDNTAHGLILAADSVPSSRSTVDLASATITGGEVATHFDGVIDATSGASTISAASIVNSGTLEVTGGTLTIDAASTVQNSGLFEANGGDLIVKTELSGNAEIGGASLLELGGAHSSANVTFLAGSTGTLKLDHADSFSGTISGLDDNTLDLGNVGYGANTTATYSGTAAGGILSIFENGVDVSDIHLSGDYLGVHWNLADDGSPQHGTDVTEVPGAISGLDSHGNAVEGSAVNALITDGGQPVSNATYQWQLDGEDIADATGASYLPTENDEGHALTVNISFTDALGQVETSSASAGTVAESPTENATIVLSGLDGNNNAIENRQITATVTEADAPASGIIYTWTVNGHTVHTGTDASGANYTPTEADEGHSIRVSVSFTDIHGNAEHGTVTIANTDDEPRILGETDAPTQAVIVVGPAAPIVLGNGVNTNSLGLDTETFDSQTAGLLSNNGAGHGDFHSATLHATFSGSGNAGVVSGALSGSTSAPFVGPLPGTADTTNYLSVGAGGTETITFDDEQNAFGLYWGSVDSYNTISFYHGATLVASYTGADVTPLFPTGNQGSFSSNGYVEFSGLASFDKVVLGSGNSNAFEVENISAGSVHAELAAPITGTVTISDANIGDTLTASVIENAVLEYNGSTTIPGNVDVSGLIASNAIKFDSVKSDGSADVLHWTYDPTNPNLDFLKSGDTLTITYAAQVNDGHGNIGSQPLTVTIAGTTTSANPSQSQVLNGTSQNDTFSNIGNHETIFGAGGHDTFVFKPGFGSATIGDFDVNNDTINIDHTLVDHGLVTSLSAFLATAQAANSNHDTILTDANHDTIKLAGVTVAQLQAHPNDFHLT